MDQRREEGPPDGRERDGRREVELAHAVEQRGHVAQGGYERVVGEEPREQRIGEERERSATPGCRARGAVSRGSDDSPRFTEVLERRQHARCKVTRPRSRAAAGELWLRREIASKAISPASS